MQLARRRVAAAGIVPAGPEDDLVEFEKCRVVGGLVPFGGQLRKVLAVFAGGRFVQHLAQTVHVGLRRAGAFRGDEPVGADKRTGFVGVGHEADVSQLGHAVHENDVRGLDIAMDQAVPVQLGDRPAQGQPEAQAFLE